MKFRRMRCQHNSLSISISYLNQVRKDPHEQVAEGKFHGWMLLLPRFDSRERFVCAVRRSAVSRHNNLQVLAVTVTCEPRVNPAWDRHSRLKSCAGDYIYAVSRRILL